MSTSPITLLAMAASGEVLIVRDTAGRTWVIQPPAAGGRRSLPPDEAERAIARHGFDRIDRDFATWGELEEFRQRRAALATPPVVIDREGLDAEDVRTMIEIAHRWIAEDEGARSLKLAHELLQVPAVRRDVDLLDAVASLLAKLREPTMLTATEPRDALSRAARERWRRVREPIAA